MFKQPSPHKYFDYMHYTVLLPAEGINTFYSMLVLIHLQYMQL
jgi:hypothetical protein